MYDSVLKRLKEVSFVDLTMYAPSYEGGLCKGKTVRGLSHKSPNKNRSFRLAINSNCQYLTITEEDLRLLEVLNQLFGKPCVRWKVRGFFGSKVMYAWEKIPQRQESLIRSLQFAEAMGGHFFGLLGHFDVTPLPS